MTTENPETPEVRQRVYELHKMKIIDRINDWARYKKSWGLGIGRWPVMAQSYTLTNMIAEQASAKRNIDRQKMWLHQCEDCQQVTVKRPARCRRCGNEDRFTRKLYETAAGKTVYASMIPSTAHQINFKAEEHLDDIINGMPDELQIPLYFNYLYGETQDDAARELSMNIKTYRHRLHRALDYLIGIFYQEHQKDIENP